MQLEETAEFNKDEEKVPRMIGGWLILVALGVLIAPIRSLYTLTTTFSPFFSDGTWEAVTTVTSEAYTPFLGPLLIGEFIITLAIVVALLYLAILFYLKKSNFPKWYAGISLFSAVFIVVDAYIVTLVFPDFPMFDQGTTIELGKSLISCIIWVPYLFLSQRSKETFIR